MNEAIRRNDIIAWRDRFLLHLAGKKAIDNIPYKE